MADWNLLQRRRLQCVCLFVRPTSLELELIVVVVAVAFAEKKTRFIPVASSWLGKVLALTCTHEPLYRTRLAAVAIPVDVRRSICDENLVLHTREFFLLAADHSKLGEPNNICIRYWLVSGSSVR